MTRYRVAIYLILGCGSCLLLAAGPSTASTNPKPSIAITTRTDANQNDHAAEITAAVDFYVNQMGDNSNADNQKAAREWLQNTAFTGVNGNPSSVEYLSAYTDALNASFLKLLNDPNVTVRAKINAALVTTKLAGSVDNSNLIGTVNKLLEDKNDSVILGGIKAARAIMPAAVQNPAPGAADPLLRALLKAVADHPTPPLGASIVREAYNALMPGFSANLKPNNIRIVAPFILQLQASRLKLYGPVLPEDPDADSLGTLMLLYPNCWAVLTPQQQAQAMQLAADLMYVASREAANNNVSPNPALFDLIDHQAISIQKLARDVLKDDNIEKAMEDPKRLGLSNQGGAIIAACDAARAAIKANGLFSNLPDPPAVNLPAQASHDKIDN